MNTIASTRLAASKANFDLFIVLPTFEYIHVNNYVNNIVMFPQLYTEKRLQSCNVPKNA